MNDFSSDLAAIFKPQPAQASEARPGPPPAAARKADTIKPDRLKSEIDRILRVVDKKPDKYTEFADDAKALRSDSQTHDERAASYKRLEVARQLINRDTQRTSYRRFTEELDAIAQDGEKPLEPSHLAWTVDDAEHEISEEMTFDRLFEARRAFARIREAAEPEWARWKAEQDAARGREPGASSNSGTERTRDRTSPPARPTVEAPPELLERLERLPELFENANMWYPTVLDELPTTSNLSSDDLRRLELFVRVAELMIWQKAEVFDQAERDFSVLSELPEIEQYVVLNSLHLLFMMGGHLHFLAQLVETVERGLALLTEPADDSE